MVLVHCLWVGTALAMAVLGAKLGVGDDRPSVWRSMWATVCIVLLATLLAVFAAGLLLLPEGQRSALARHGWFAAALAAYATVAVVWARVKSIRH